MQCDVIKGAQSQCQCSSWKTRNENERNPAIHLRWTLSDLSQKPLWPLRWSSGGLCASDEMKLIIVLLRARFNPTTGRPLAGAFVGGVLRRETSNCNHISYDYTHFLGSLGDNEAGDHSCLQ